ncbi:MULTISPECIES: hypothetical protein [Xenorhabdus]|uniref:Lipoprotein n=1 Tax=Xenorhabdus stockiae TaxID=351614 RepID=A0A2D0KBQ4_9GAMM|nr:MULTISPECIES: hypothetical protein [Xenorhabdus]PHM60637.1 hypothetical protein Xsto_03794 [Xenorhabdus stockiae]
MKRLIVGMTTALALSGCAQMTDSRPIPVINTEPVTCNSEAMCSYLWSIVPDKIGKASRMKVSSESDTFISTYPAIDTRQLGARVAKIQQPNGDYQMKATFYCHRHATPKDCERDIIDATNFFNKVMGLYKADYLKR